MPMQGIIWKLLVVSEVWGLSTARTQAHLPLSPGLPLAPPLPPTHNVLYGGAPDITYGAPATEPSMYGAAVGKSLGVGTTPVVAVGGSPLETLSAALSDVPLALPKPFQEWDVNRPIGPGVFDCPHGFALTPDNTCTYVEFRKPEESCPYGTYRDRSMKGCIQIDSVPPARTCPSGFEYFMKGCIRRTQISPTLVCPAGFTQIEDGCYSVTSIPPEARCPGGFALRREDGRSVCYREHILRPEYACMHANAKVVLKSPNAALTEDEQHAVLDSTGIVWTVSPHLPRCVATVEHVPTASCPANFALVDARKVSIQNLVAEGMNALEQAKTSWNKTEEDNLQCTQIVDYPGEVLCDPEYELFWENVVDRDLYKGARCRKVRIQPDPVQVPPPEPFNLVQFPPPWAPNLNVSDLNKVFKLTEATSGGKGEDEGKGEDKRKELLRREEGSEERDHESTKVSVPIPEPPPLIPPSSSFLDHPSPEFLKKLWRPSITILSEPDDPVPVETIVQELSAQTRMLAALEEHALDRSDEETAEKTMVENTPTGKATASMSGNGKHRSAWGKKLQGTAFEHEVVTPHVVFPRASCRELQSSDIQWVNLPVPMEKSKKEAIYPNVRPSAQLMKPVCREIQEMPPVRMCPHGGRVKCLLPPEEPAEERRLEKHLQSKSEGKPNSKKSTKPSPQKSQKSSQSSSVQKGNSKKKSGTKKSSPARQLYAIDYNRVLPEGGPSLLEDLVVEISDEKRRRLTEATKLSDESISISVCEGEMGGRAMCEVSQTSTPAEPYCSKGFLTDRPVQSDVIYSEDWAEFEDEDDVHDHLAGVGLRVAVCVDEETTPPLLQCPLNVGIVGSATGLCEVLLAQPIEATCPEGYTRGTHDTLVYGPDIPKRTKKFAIPLLPAPTGGVDDVCELLEYADYQITCPVGYKRDRAKNSAQACLAEKPVTPSIVCPPGFVRTGGSHIMNMDDDRACMKTVEVAPTIISFPSETIPVSHGHYEGPIATACVLTKDRKLSCGVERKYHGATDFHNQLIQGQKYKAKQDLKGKKYLDKYTSNFF